MVTLLATQNMKRTLDAARMIENGGSALQSGLTFLYNLGQKWDEDRLDRQSNTAVE